MLTLKTATYSDHPALLALFKQAKCTQGFGNNLYSGPVAYQKGWIVMCLAPGDELVGAYCVRHCIRKPQTSLYFIAVDQAYHRNGVGTKLLEHLQATAPSGRVVLGVERDNTAACAFYTRHGFRVTGECYEGHGLTMEWTL